MAEQNQALRPRQVLPIVQRSAIANRPIFIWGPPGIGKSDIVHQIAESPEFLAGLVQAGKIPDAKAAESKPSKVIDLRMALLEPTDLRGYPFMDQATGTMRWAPASDLPSQEEAEKYNVIILFLDELNSAPPSVMAAAYQLTLNRRIGEYVLPDNVVIVAAGNRDSDKGVTYRMPSPLANRFRHIEMREHFPDWQQWAILNRIDRDVIAFLTANKGDLFDYEPKKSGHAFATPRSWTYVHEILQTPGFETAGSTLADDDTDPAVLRELEQQAEIAGAVGEGMAIKFLQYRKIAADMPDPEDVLKGKVKKLQKGVATEISAQYSIAIGMAYEIHEAYESKGHKIQGELRDWLNNALRFAYDSLKPELVIFFFKTIMTDYKIRLNIRDDLDEEVKDVFDNKYVKYFANA